MMHCSIIYQHVRTIFPSAYTLAKNAKCWSDHSGVSLLFKRMCHTQAFEIIQSFIVIVNLEFLEVTVSAENIPKNYAWPDKMWSWADWPDRVQIEYHLHLFWRISYTFLLTSHNMIYFFFSVGDFLAFWCGLSGEVCEEEKVRKG